MKFEANQLNPGSIHFNRTADKSTVHPTRRSPLAHREYIPPALPEYNNARQVLRERLSAGSRFTLPAERFVGYGGYFPGLSRLERHIAVHAPEWVPPSRMPDTAAIPQDQSVPEGTSEVVDPQDTVVDLSKKRRKKAKRPIPRHPIQRTIAAVATAIVGVTTPLVAAACDSAPVVNAIQFDAGVSANGVVNWEKTVNDFGKKIPQAVIDREDSVTAVVNITAGVNENTKEFIPSIEEGTGWAINFNGVNLGFTAAHTIRGGPNEQGQVISLICGSASELYDGGSTTVKTASTDYSPVLAQKNKSTPDYALLDPGPGSIPAIPLGKAPSAREKVYVLSDQPTDNQDQVINPENGIPPTILKAVVIGREPGFKDQYIILTGIGSTRNGITNVKQGASGAPVLDSNGQAVGEVIETSTQVYIIHNGNVSASLLKQLKEYWGVKAIKISGSKTVSFSFAIIQVPDPKVLSEVYASRNNKKNQCLK